MFPLIPGIVISVLTFPGVIVHEAAHFLFCRLGNVAILDACFFQLRDPMGYVVHGPTKDFRSTFLVCIGPFIVNSLACAAICFPLWIPMQFFGIEEPFNWFMLWLGVSIGMHAFPSNQDASNVWAEAKEAAKGGDWLARLSMPLVVVIWVANALRFFWIDYAYGLALGVWLPGLILG